MRAKSLFTRLALLGVVTLAFACSDRDPPTAAASNQPVPQADHSLHGARANVVGAAATPFTFRAPMDPHRIQQLPDFMIQSRVRKDIVIQQLVFAPGAGPWHTHPGPSFVYVVSGQIQVEKFNKEAGCLTTPVFGGGQAYFEIANEVHRAVVVSADPAVLLVTRFNIPVGGAITVMAADPGC